MDAPPRTDEPQSLRHALNNIFFSISTYAELAIDSLSNDLGSVPTTADYLARITDAARKGHRLAAELGSRTDI